MLTKTDLVQIGKVIDEKLEVKLEKKLKPVNHKLSKIQKDLKTTIEFFDNDVTKLKIRVNRVEEHLGLPPIDNLSS